MQTKVIIFNGPPGSGKDHACLYLRHISDSIHHLEFKSKLIELTCAIYDITIKEFYSIYTRELKELPSEIFNGLSPRQALIFVSEDVIKPKFGKDYMGVSATKRIQQNKINAFSDGGFYEELEPVYNKVGAENMLIARIYRNGYTYEGDSRNYIKSFKDVNIIDINNNGTLEEFESKIMSIYKGIQQ